MSARVLFVVLPLALAACDTPEPAEVGAADTASSQRDTVGDAQVCADEPGAERTTCCTCEWTPGTTVDIECHSWECDVCCDVFAPIDLEH